MGTPKAAESCPGLAGQPQCNAPVAGRVDLAVLASGSAGQGLLRVAVLVLGAVASCSSTVKLREICCTGKRPTPISSCTSSTIKVVCAPGSLRTHKHGAADLPSPPARSPGWTPPGDGSLSPTFGGCQLRTESAVNHQRRIHHRRRTVPNSAPKAKV